MSPDPHARQPGEEATAPQTPDDSSKRRSVTFTTSLSYEEPPRHSVPLTLRPKDDDEVNSSPEEQTMPIRHVTYVKYRFSYDSDLESSPADKMDKMEGVEYTAQSQKQHSPHRENKKPKLDISTDSPATLNPKNLRIHDAQTGSVIAAPEDKKNVTASGTQTANAPPAATTEKPKERYLRPGEAVGPNSWHGHGSFIKYRKACDVVNRQKRQEYLEEEERKKAEREQGSAGDGRDQLADDNRRTEDPASASSNCS